MLLVKCFGCVFVQGATHSFTESGYSKKAPDHRTSTSMLTLSSSVLSPTQHPTKTLRDKPKISHLTHRSRFFHLQRSTDITQVSIFSHSFLFSLQSTPLSGKRVQKLFTGAVPFSPQKDVDILVLQRYILVPKVTY